MNLLEVHAAAAAPWGERLLDGIHFSLPKGAIMAVVGPNGAGKTSLLHLLAGGIKLANGEVNLQGKPLREWPLAARARAIALLPQQSLLNFPYRVEEVILLARLPHASGATRDRQILDEVLAATDCSALRHRLYTRLSGGERQRVQLARAMAQLWHPQDSPARLLLLDEPTTGLDLAHQQLLMRSLRKLATEGCAIIMVVHDFNLAASNADRILVLDHGRQVAEAPPPEVLTKDLFKQVFAAAVHIERHPLSGAPLVIQV